jgi:hypothetical protein
MPKYLSPDSFGIVRGPTGFMDRVHAGSLVQATAEQVYPCLADGTPTTEPTETEQATQRQAAKSDNLRAAETAYLQFCASLGFTQKAGTTELQTAILNMEDFPLSVQYGISALALIHEVEIHGGNYYGIPDTLAEVTA